MKARKDRKRSKRRDYTVIAPAPGQIEIRHFHHCRQARTFARSVPGAVIERNTETI